MATMEALMNDDRLEREISIEASLDRVWTLVTQPGFWVAEPDEPHAEQRPS